MKTLPHEWQEPEISHWEILSIWGSDSELLSISHDLFSSSSASRSFSATEAPTGTESHVSETATSPMRDLPSMDFSLELRWEFLLASDQAFSSDSFAVVIDFYIKTNLTIFFTIIFQPITNINGDTALSVNGEIYNHIVSKTSYFLAFLIWEWFGFIHVI